ncbi:MAG: hypothetical protein IKC01_08200, partial [Clostridia bacterium]|nr:hypothetical protein [Clostridia bacterium]
LEEAAELLSENTVVLTEFKNFKMPKKLLRLIKENKKKAINLSLSVKRNSLEVRCLAESAEALRCITDAVYKINNETERIIINNN